MKYCYNNLKSLQEVIFMFNATPFLKLYALYRQKQLKALNPVTCQERTLLKLVATATNTRFGAEHNFASIRSVSDFQKRVPLRYYEDFWRDYWQKPFPELVDCTWPGKIPYFPVSSGTSSGTTKYIPLTQAMFRSNRKASLDLLVHHLTNKPDSQIFGGKCFMLGGSTELVEEAPGIFSGDLSGIILMDIPLWAQGRYFPSRKTALIKNWEKKIDILAKLSREEDIRMISGVPAWMLIFFDRMGELYPELEGSIKKIFPKLEMLVHGGVNFAPYLKQFNDLLDQSQAEMREVYPASEGFIAVADRGYGEGLKLMLDNDIFFEFVPLEELDKENPTRHWVKDIEKDINYAVVMTTCAGLWSYVIGDTVKFIDTDPPRLLITGRTSYYLSAFGEHLIGEEIEDAVSQAAEKIKHIVSDYSVGAVFPQNSGELGGHLFVVEFKNDDLEDETLSDFAEYLDKRLCERNEDYEAHRAEGFGLKAPTIMAVKSGSFKEWMKSRGKLGGQNKVPRIITDQELFDDLKDFVTNNDLVLY